MRQFRLFVAAIAALLLVSLASAPAVAQVTAQPFSVWMAQLLTGLGASIEAQSRRVTVDHFADDEAALAGLAPADGDIAYLIDSMELHTWADDPGAWALTATARVGDVITLAVVPSGVAAAVISAIPPAPVLSLEQYAVFEPLDEDGLSIGHAADPGTEEVRVIADVVGVPWLGRLQADAGGGGTLTTDDGSIPITDDEAGGERVYYHATDGTLVADISTDFYVYTSTGRILVIYADADAATRQEIFGVTGDLLATFGDETLKTVALDRQRDAFGATRFAVPE